MRRLCNFMGCNKKPSRRFFIEGKADLGYCIKHAREVSKFLQFGD